MMRISKIQRNQTAPIEMLDSYLVGLDGATLLHQHFADSYEQNIAGLPVTPQSLLYAVALFMSLAEQHLVRTIDFYDIGNANDLQWCQKLSHRDALGILEESVFWLNHPAPLAFGMEVTDEYREIDLGMGENLIYALWHVCSDTMWAMLDSHVLSEISGLPVLQQLLRIPPGVDMAMLADLLTEPVIHNGELVVDVPLGEILRYAFGSTSNMFANFSQVEMADAQAHGASAFSWWEDSEHLVEHRQQQHEAEALAFNFRQLAIYCEAEPELLREIARTLIDTAWVVINTTEEVNE